MKIKLRKKRRTLKHTMYKFIFFIAFILFISNTISITGLITYINYRNKTLIKTINQDYKNVITDMYLKVEEGEIDKQNFYFRLEKIMPPKSQILLYVNGEEVYNTFQAKVLYMMKHKYSDEKLENVVVTSKYFYALIKERKVTYKKTINLKIYLACETSKEAIFVRAHTIILLTTSVIGLLIYMIALFRLKKEIMNPITTIINTAEKISISALDNRIVLENQGTDEAKRLVDVLNNMIERLENSFKIQNGFICGVSHELRTPISIIKGYINLIDRWGKDDPEVLNESIEAIKQEADGIQEMIEKLLFLAKRKLKEVKLKLAKVELNKIIDKIAFDTKLLTQKHKIIVDMKEKIEIFCDEQLISQCLRAVVDNSIKYTPNKGKIFISVKKLKDEHVLIQIKDTGIGINQKELKLIFNKFYRTDDSRTKETGGSGLGLSIVKKIVELHEGTVWAGSIQYQGTTIFIKLPLMNKNLENSKNLGEIEE